jgi:phage protein D
MATGFSIQFDGNSDEGLGSPASVEVYECIGSSTSFRLRYPLDIENGDLPLLKEGRLSAATTITVVVPAKGSFVSLVNGPVRGQQIHLEHGGAGSTLDVLGADSSLAMDREDKAALWPNLTDSAAVTTIIGQHGFLADVEPTAAGHFEAKHVLVQRETDLAFVRRLAARNGCCFWVTHDAAAKAETAHFKRMSFDAAPSTELVINLTDPSANVAAIEIEWDSEAPSAAVAAQLDLNTKSNIDGAVSGSPLAGLGSQRLAAIGKGPRILHIATSVDDAGDLRSRSEAALIDAELFIKARGHTTAGVLGGVLRSHTIVKLRGAGSRHSGKWLCHSVRHIIDAVEHRMEFELLRNGWEE